MINDLFSIGCFYVGAWIWGVFAILGICLIFLAFGYGVRGMMLRRTELPKVEVSVNKFVPGTTFRLKIGPISRGGLSRLSARLVSQESIPYQDHEGAKIITIENIVSELCHGNSLPMETTGSVPQTAMPSFSIVNPGFERVWLEWYLTVNGRILWVIPYSLRYPITIHSGNA